MSDHSSEINELVRALNRLSVAIEDSGRQNQERWEVVSEAPEEPATANIPVGDYHTAAEQLPPCPPHLAAAWQEIGGRRILSRVSHQASLGGRILGLSGLGQATSTATGQPSTQYQALHLRHSPSPSALSSNEGIFSFRPLQDHRPFQ